MDEVLQWYAYRLHNGEIHVKRYLDDPGDIEEAQSSCFVDVVHGPFEAADKEEALETARRVLAKYQLLTC